LFELDSIRRIFVKGDDIISSLFNINLRLKRSINILNVLIDQLELLESMTPIEFLEFREYLTSGSGFQSLQFRIIEMKLGLTDRFRSSYKTKYSTETMFNGVDAVELKQAVNEVSLLIGIEVICKIILLLDEFSSYYSVLYSDGWNTFMIIHPSIFSSCSHRL
jgi:tryptophan 2,3-dioxygenase